MTLTDAAIIHPKKDDRQASRGRRQQHLPWGSLPLDEISVGDRCMPACLPGTIRSQGFSPSQRVHPTDASWPCFMPHPSTGFTVFRAFPTRQAVTPLDVRCSPVVPCSGASPVHATSEPSSGRASDTLSAVINRKKGRCSLDLPPLRGLPIPDAGPKPSPPMLGLATADVRTHGSALGRISGSSHPSLGETTRAAPASMRFSTSSLPHDGLDGCKQPLLPTRLPFRRPRTHE